MKKYDVVEAPSFQELARGVEIYLNSGWKVAGGIAITSISFWNQNTYGERYQDFAVSYAQALIFED